jgi:glycosyltransferase involved in cell wall biosynthesis
LERLTSGVSRRRPDAGPPVVSVIIPAYNAAPYIRESLDSVFAQTFASYEVIVVNDGSPDTEDLERALARYRDSLVYIRQENRGPGGARNTGVLAAQGEYVAFLDSDDRWRPEYLVEQLRVLTQDSRLDLSYADALLFGDPASDGRTFMQNSPSRGAVTFASLVRGECHVITSCVVARRRALLDAGLFDEQYFHAEDFDLWLRLAHRGGRITYQERVLAEHRKSDGSLSTETTRMIHSVTDILRKTARTLDLSPEERELVARKIAESEAFGQLEYGKQQLIAGNYDEAADAVERANTYYRSGKLRLLLVSLRVAPRPLRGVYGFLLRRQVLKG